MTTPKNIKWFWAHRRNTSLHHMSMFGEGLKGKGYLPLCDFSFDHQLYLGVPGKGCYIFYDRRQLSQADCYRRIQKSVDTNPDFVPQIRRRTEELFGVLFLRCREIDEANLELLPNGEIFRMYERFVQDVTAGPMLSVQLWGIEALLQPQYRIDQFLARKFTGTNREARIQSAKEILLTNVGETVVFSEQKDFLRLATNLSKNKRLRKIFRSEPAQSIALRLRRFVQEDGWIAQHIQKYSWINSEYVSGVWPKVRWLRSLQETLRDPTTPATRLRRLELGFRESLRRREALLSKLNPPREVRHAIESLAEFVAQRDWSKGYFVKALLSYQRLLDEMARRIGESSVNLLNYSFTELSRACAVGKRLPRSLLASRRKHGYIILNKTSTRAVISGRLAIRTTLKRERVIHPDDILGTSVSKIQGLPASAGRAVGKVRVIDDPTHLSTFRRGEILVTYMTTMEFTPVFRKAAAVVTDEGGMSSHAAIVSREFALPCIVGTKVATKVFKTGDVVEVDAVNGVIRRLKQP